MLLKPLLQDNLEALRRHSWHWRQLQGVEPKAENYKDYRVKNFFIVAFNSKLTKMTKKSECTNLSQIVDYSYKVNSSNLPNGTNTMLAF